MSARAARPRLPPLRARRRTRWWCAAELAPRRRATAPRPRPSIAEIVRWRREHQPGGANAGSVFTNPPGDSAGRLHRRRRAQGPAASAPPRCRPSTPTSSRPTRAARPTTCVALMAERAGPRAPTAHGVDAACRDPPASGFDPRRRPRSTVTGPRGPPDADGPGEDAARRAPATAGPRSTSTRASRARRHVGRERAPASPSRLAARGRRRGRRRSAAWCVTRIAAARRRRTVGRGRGARVRRRRRSRASGVARRRPGPRRRRGRRGPQRVEQLPWVDTATVDATGPTAWSRSPSPSARPWRRRRRPMGGRRLVDATGPRVARSRGRPTPPGSRRSRASTPVAPGGDHRPAPTRRPLRRSPPWPRALRSRVDRRGRSVADGIDRCELEPGRGWSARRRRPTLAGQARGRPHRLDRSAGLEQPIGVTHRRARPARTPWSSQGPEVSTHRCEYRRRDSHAST